MTEQYEYKPNNFLSEEMLKNYLDKFHWYSTSHHTISSMLNASTPVKVNSFIIEGNKYIKVLITINNKEEKKF